MGNQRFLLYITLFFVSYLIWAQWHKAYGPKPVINSPTTQVSEKTPQHQAGNLISPGIIPEAIVTGDHKIARKNIQQKSNDVYIQVKTDLIDAEIDTRGGDIKKLELLKYLVKAGGSKKINILSKNPNEFQVVQSGLVSVEKGVSPSHNQIYRAEKLNYRLETGENEIKVPLYWTNSNGLTVKKVLIFKRNSYEVDVNYYITAGSKRWSGSDYMQIVHQPPVVAHSKKFDRSYKGGVLYNSNIKYEKQSYSDLAKKNINKTLKNGWLAIINHYFITAWIPEKAKNNLYYSRYLKNKDQYILGVRSPAFSLEPEKTLEIKNRLVIGPKLQNRLEKIEPGLELTVDYGILTIIAKPLFWLLTFFHTMTGNWGWAIILLTISVKGAFYKLSEMSYRSMARMRMVAPRIKQMKERFGGDRQAMSKAMMDMYKKEKINPMGGCLPILIQMPVFLSLYWVLLDSVEMRQAPFIFWITNLSDKDPFFILPVLMGISMFIQQKLNPAPVDPIQQKVFQVMPFAFTFMFAFFPSGLVLYWVVNNILSITQQYIITRRLERSA